jgi:hypothetical protein
MYFSLATMLSALLVVAVASPAPRPQGKECQASTTEAFHAGYIDLKTLLTDFNGLIDIVDTAIISLNCRVEVVVTRERAAREVEAPKVTAE